MAIDIERVVREFKEYDLDPGKLDTKKVFSELLNIKATLDLSSMEKCRQANSFLASLFQVIGYKAGVCHYWERVLEEQIKVKKMQARIKARAVGGTKEEMTDAVDSDEDILKLSEKLSIASASRFFWGHLLEMLHEISKRVDSASASLGVESKLKNTGS